MKQKSLYKDITLIFCIISLIGLFATILRLFFSHGEYFSSLFFYDSLDTGMDFFHSIEYTRGRTPYSKFSTLYPPLANVFFYALFRFVPEWQYQNWKDTFKDGVNARGSSTDLRIWQPTMILFISFIIVSTMLCIFLIIHIFKNNYHAYLVSLCCIFSYGMLYSFERGNITILAMICCLIFVIYYDSPNPVLREISLILLAFSAGLKIYPAILGFILLYNKKYFSTLRAIWYGLAFIILPCFLLKDGLESIPLFLEQLLNFAQTDTFSCKGLSFNSCLSSIIYLFSKIFNFSLENNEFVLTVLPKLNLIVTILLIFIGFMQKKLWQQSLTCCLALTLFSDQGLYTTIFFIIPLLLMLKEETTLKKENLFPFLFLVGMIVVLPLSISKEAPFSTQYFRFQVCIIALFVYAMTIMIKNFLKRIREHKSITQTIQ